MEQVQQRGGGGYTAMYYQGAAPPGNDGLKARAKLGGSTTEGVYLYLHRPLSIHYVPAMWGVMSWKMLRVLFHLVFLGNEIMSLAD